MPASFNIIKINNTFKTEREVSHHLDDEHQDEEVLNPPKRICVPEPLWVYRQNAMIDPDFNQECGR